MGIEHINNVTPKDLENAGVNKREYDIIKKLMKMDPQIFEIKEFNTNISPYTYTVDLSKYDKIKIPQDCKEILMRPTKMRTIYERYWALASDLDKRDREKKEERLRKKYQGSFLKKTEIEYKLMDKVIQIIDRVAQQESQKKDRAIDKLNKKKNRFSTALIKDGFQFHAEKIMNQIKDKGFCTKSQLEYLKLYNSHVD